MYVYGNIFQWHEYQNTIFAKDVHSIISSIGPTHFSSGPDVYREFRHSIPEYLYSYILEYCQRILPTAGYYQIPIGYIRTYCYMQIESWMCITLCKGIGMKTYRCQRINGLTFKCQRHTFNPIVFIVSSCRNMTCDHTLNGLSYIRHIRFEFYRYPNLWNGEVVLFNDTRWLN